MYKKRITKLSLIAVLLVLIIIFIKSAIDERNKLLSTYQIGIDYINDQNYYSAIDTLSTLGDYKDSLAYIDLAEKFILYNQAIDLFENERYEESADKFTLLGDFEDSIFYVAQSQDCLQQKISEETQETEKNNLYNEALNYYNINEYEKALEKFINLGDYENSIELAQECSNILTRLKLSSTISAGIKYSAAISQSGNIYFSGEDFTEEDTFKQWEDMDIISISVKGHFVMGLDRFGKVVIAGQLKDYYIDTSTWSDIIDISAGQLYIVGLRSDGTLVAQGHNGDGQANISEWNHIVDITTGWRHTVGLDSNGNIFITGYKSQEQLAQIQEHSDEWTDIIAISAGGGYITESGHTVALRSDGTVVAVGNNLMGQCNVSEWTDIIAISAGDFHTVGLKSDGTVVTTLSGDEFSDSIEEINEWKNIVSISAGHGFTLGLKSDGTVVSAGYNNNDQANTESWNNILILE